MLHPQTITTYQDIDWQLLWQNARAEKSWKSSEAKDWSSRADGFAERVIDSPFSKIVLDHLDLRKTDRVLDVGCGPGTLALPIAERAAEVTAIDYAPGMLSRLQRYAEERGLSTIRTICCAWQDDWAAAGIGLHDCAVASRSLNIAEPAAAIAKLNAHVTRRVFLVERIAPTPFDADAFSAIGRPFRSGPDYISTLNILYTLNIHPQVTPIAVPSITIYRDLDQALDRYRWMFKDLTPQEEQRLMGYLREHITAETRETITVTSRLPQRWVIIAWDKPPASPGAADDLR